MQQAEQKWSPLCILTGVFILSALPLLIVEMFPGQLKFVMDPSSYIVFHNIVEFFSIMVSLSMFGMSWYTYEQSRNRHALFLGTAFLAIGIMDFMHTMSMPAMPDFITPNDPQKSVQFWMPVRLFQGVAFLASAYIYPDNPIRWLSKRILLTASLLVSALVFIGIIFFQAHMPAFFVYGVGVTPLKKTCEYAVIFLLGAATAAYWRRMDKTGDRLLIYYLAAFIVSIFSELPLAFYARAFDTYNVLGHINKVIAFFLIYYGVYRTSVKAPYLRLTEVGEKLKEENAERKRTEEALREAHDHLEVRVEERTAELAQSNEQLQEEIEERRKAEDALRRAHDRALWLAHFPEENPNPILRAAEDGTVLYCNPASARVPGCECKAGQPLQGELLPLFRRAMAEGKGLQADVEIGERTYFIWIAPFPKERYANIYGIDITGRKQAEDVVRESQSRLETVFASIPDVILEYDAKGKPVRANEAALKAAGLISLDFTRDQVLAKLDFRAPDGNAVRAEDLPVSRALRGEKVSDELYSVRTADGVERVVSTYAAPLYKDDQITGAVALWHDITELKRAEEVRRTSEERIRSLGDNLPGGAIYQHVLHPDGRVRYAYMSAGIEKIIGLSAERVMADPDAFRNLIVEEDRPVCAAAEEKALREWGPYDCEFRQRTASGEIKWVHCQSTPHRLADGSILWDGVVVDITARKRAEEKIRRQNALQQAINRIFREAIARDTEEDLGQVCLDVIEDVTRSKFSFIGEIGPDGLLHDIAISDPEWELCTMYDKTGHRRAPGDFKIHGLYGRVLKDGKSFYANDPASHPNSIGTPEGHPPLKSFLGVPLAREGQTIGMIAVGNREGGYGREELEALEALAPAVLECFGRKRAEIGLRQRTLELQQLNQTLELRVRKRTEELANSRERLQHLASQLLLAQEKERKRVAVDLHDGLLSELAAMKMLFEAKMKLLEQGKLADLGEFRKVSDILALVMKEARGIMNNLHPSVLDELGLIAAINWMSGEYQKAYPDITVQKRIEVSEQDISDSVKVVIYRVLQEALNNFAKHGKGDRVDLSLAKSDHSFALLIRDNGKGFDVEKARKGLGLESMRERVELSGGQFLVESALGQGTTIRAVWSLNAP